MLLLNGEGREDKEVEEISIKNKPVLPLFRVFASAPHLVLYVDPTSKVIVSLTTKRRLDENEQDVDDVDNIFVQVIMNAHVEGVSTLCFFCNSLLPRSHTANVAVQLGSMACTGLIANVAFRLTLRKAV